MKRIIPIILLLILSTYSHAQTPKPLLVRETERVKTGNWAIIIGVNDYASKDIADLKYCQSDADRLANTLIAQGWDSNNIKKFIGPNATYENIYNTVKNISGLQYLPPDSTLIFFFSGHGTMIDNLHYLIPYDGSANPDLVKGKNNQLEDIESRISKSKFAKKLIFIDACRNEFSKSAKNIWAGQFGKISSPGGMRLFLSCLDGQFSYENDDLRSGVFTYCLIDGLSSKNADTDKDGVVRLNELEGYVAKQMEKISFKYGNQQQMFTDGPCDPLLPLTIVGTTPPPSQGPTVPVKPPQSQVPLYSEIRTLSGKFSSADSVAFSPDGATLASGNSNRTIKLWSISSGECIRNLTGHTSYQISVAFSPNGATLASGCYDSTIKLWTVSTGTCIRTFSAHSPFGINSIAFSPDGSTIASVSDDRTIKLWSVSTGNCIRTLTGHSDMVKSVAFSPDGKTLASGSSDKTIKLWSVASGNLIRTLSGHSGSALSVAFSPNGATLASGSFDNTIRLWSVSSGQCLRTFSGHSQFIESVDFSPDGSTLASGSWDSTIKLWSVSTGQCISTLSRHTQPVYSIRFSPDGSMLASGSLNEIKLWRVK